MSNYQNSQPRRNPNVPMKKRGQFQGKRLAPLPEMEKKGSARNNGKQPRQQNSRQAKPPRGNKSHEATPPSPPSGLSGDLNRLLGKLGSLSLETEDLLLLAVLYLMYRESGDKELLIMMGALLFM